MRLIVVDNAGDKIGGTLFSAHLATALAHNHHTVLVASTAQNALLEMFTARRYAYNLGRNTNLPVARYVSAKKDVLEQLGAETEFAVMDFPEQKSLKSADILVTFISNKETCLALAQKGNLYAERIFNAKKERAALGKSTFKWFIVPTFTLSTEETSLLQTSGKYLGYTLTPMLEHLECYTQGLQEGITFIDKDQKDLKKDLTQSDFFARRNFKKIVEFIFSGK